MNRDSSSQTAPRVHGSVPKEGMQRIYSVSFPDPLSVKKNHLGHQQDQLCRGTIGIHTTHASRPIFLFICTTQQISETNLHLDLIL